MYVVDNFTSHEIGLVLKIRVLFTIGARRNRRTLMESIRVKYNVDVTLHHCCDDRRNEYSIDRRRLSAPGGDTVLLASRFHVLVTFLEDSITRM